MPAPAYSMPAPASSMSASSTSSEYSNHFDSGELFPATDYSDLFSNNASSQHQSFSNNAIQDFCSSSRSGNVIMELSNTFQQNNSYSGGELNVTAKLYVDYYNHASGEMIPLLSSGSTQQKGTTPVIESPVTFQKPPSIEVADKENVPSKFSIRREIAKTIYNRVGRKMSLFTRKMMDFLFPVSYLTSHRMTDNGYSGKQAADKQHISELINCVLSFFPEEKESAIRTMIR
ncbi:hypothetical protein DAPPUDRAFT_323451 [Daphnia pulex]|uniref:BEN domain-containing protein n=1 Tax=Daphnia pulex TaxID=6669 RepID=E9GYW2_DAPPU|nr:hypothetical protein DAPPUDRAFT_323451 [Daphnia pulex]|eukprot:EFX75339.1 hypothetical protein DAPPUDRAFT_323451 [Daphnia pulex]